MRTAAKFTGFLGALLLPLAAQAQEAATPTINSGDTAWLLVSSALVMLMTPGLAFFYAGMVRSKNVVSTLFKSYAALAVVGVLWAVVGYSIAFAPGNGDMAEYMGDWKTFFLLNGVGQEPLGTVPHLAFMAFQMMFAIITPALIIGSVVERVSFKAWLIILGLWSVLIYAPIAHWVWQADGWVFKAGGLDFAGGLVVHISSGVSALVAALLFGRRIPDGEPARPSDVSMVMLGAALLWFGWFGFNAGSALAANGLAAHAFVTTFLAAASAFLAWMFYDWILYGKPTAVGGAIGLVVGLVVITPAAGFVTPGHAMLMGLLGGVVCNFVSRQVKKATHLDDALDVFACHGVGGIIGSLLTGLLASKAVNPAIQYEGWLVGGDSTLFLINAKATGTVILFAVIGTFIIIKLVGLIIKLRVSEDSERVGLDETLHGEIFRSK